MMHGDPTAFSLVDGQLQWSRALVVEDVANAYRRASLAGADMVRFASAVEAAIAQSDCADDPFRCSRAITKVSFVEMDQLTSAQLLALRDDVLVRTHSQILEFASTPSHDSTNLILAISACLVAWETATASDLIHASPATLDPMPHDELERGLSLIDQRRFETTAPIFELFGHDVRISPKQRAQHLASAALVTLYHQGLADRAIALFDEATSVLADVPEVVGTRPHVWQWIGLTKRAEAGYKEAIRAFPDHGAAYVGMGDCALAHERFNVAESWYRRARQNAVDGENGLFESVTLSLQQFLSSLDETSDAQAQQQAMQEIESEISLAEAVEPTSRWSLQHRLFITAMSDAEGSQPDSNRRSVSLGIARSAAQRLIELEPQWAIGHVRLGRVLLATGDEVGANDSFKQAMAVDQFPVGDIERSVGLAYLSQSDTVDSEPSEPGEWLAAALEWFERALQRSDDSNRQLNRTSVLGTKLKMDPSDRAVQAETLAMLKAEPDRSGLVDALIEAIRKETDDDRRLEALHGVALAVSPMFRSMVENEIGNEYYGAGNYEEALVDYQRAVDACPDDPTVLRNLALAQRDLGQWAAARTTIDLAHAVDDDDVAYADALARLDNAQGNSSFSAEMYADAVASYESAIARAPAEAVYHRNLSGALIRLPTSDVDHRIRAVERAILALEQSMRLEPEVDQTAEIAGLRRQVDDSRTYGLVATSWEPLSTPLRIECSTALLPVTIDEARQLLPDVSEAINDARAWIRETYGVPLPGIRLREDTSLAAGDFIVRIFDDHVAQAHIHPFERLVLGDIDAPGRSVDLFDGRHGSLCSLSDLAPGQDSINPLIIAIDAVVRAILLNLPRFVGCQETATMLAELNTEGLKPDLLARFDDASRLVALTLVLKGLLAEHVPITALSDISELVDELGATGSDITSMIEAARALPSVRLSLPGRAAGREYVMVSPAVTNMFVDSVVQGPEPVVCLAPAVALGLEQGVQALDLKETQCVVVSEPSVRPFVREFLRLHSRNNPVLAIREVDDLPSWTPLGVDRPEWRLEMDEVGK